MKGRRDTEEKVLAVVESWLKTWELRRLTFQTIQLLSVCVEFSVDIQQTIELSAKKKEPGKQKKANAKIVILF